MAIGGYFAEGTARKVIRPVSGKWDDENALLPVIDWLGSSLGHAIELKDTDLIAPGAAACRRWGIAALAGAALAAAGAAIPRRKREKTGTEEL